MSSALYHSCHPETSYYSFLGRINNPRSQPVSRSVGFVIRPPKYRRSSGFAARHPAGCRLACQEFVRLSIRISNPLPSKDSAAGQRPCRRSFHKKGAAKFRVGDTASVGAGPVPARWPIGANVHGGLLRMNALSGMRAGTGPAPTSAVCLTPHNFLQSHKKNPPSALAHSKYFRNFAEEKKETI